MNSFLYCFSKETHSNSAFALFSCGFEVQSSIELICRKKSKDNTSERSWIKGASSKLMNVWPLSPQKLTSSTDRFMTADHSRYCSHRPDASKNLWGSLLLSIPNTPLAWTSTIVIAFRTQSIRPYISLLNTLKQPT